MSRDDVTELVWENGQILMRGGRSNAATTTTAPSCRSYSKAARELEKHDVTYGVEDHNHYHHPVLIMENMVKDQEKSYFVKEGEAHVVPVVNNASLQDSFADPSNQDVVSANWKEDDVQGSGKRKQMDLRNFSQFLHPVAHVQGKGPKNSPRIDGLKTTKEKSPDPAASKIHPPDIARFDYQKTETNNSGNEAQAAVKPVDVSIPDEQSEVVFSRHLDGASTGKHSRLHDDRIRDDLRRYDSTCSLGASNNQTRCEGSERMTLQSENSEKEEQICTKKQVRGNKRKRSAKFHSVSEKKRRGKINEKMRVLQNLLPSSDKVDTASMLDKAIEYVKTLQLQVQLMSMGAGICMPPPMLLPTPLNPIAMGINTRLPMGSIGFNIPIPFPTSMGILTPQMLQMPSVLSRPPFVPLTGVSTPQVVPPTQASVSALGSSPVQFWDAVQKRMNVNVINSDNSHNYHPSMKNSE